MCVCVLGTREQKKQIQRCGEAKKVDLQLKIVRANSLSSKYSQNIEILHFVLDGRPALASDWVPICRI